MDTQYHKGWEVRESGPSDADHAILLLPGTLATAAFFGELMAESELSKASIRLVATTLPGYGGTKPAADSSIEGYAKEASRLADDLGCDAVLGHSTGANVALEMAAGVGFKGPLALLSPSFSRKDEPQFPRAVDRLSSVLGHWPWSLAVKSIGSALKMDVPKQRQEALVAEMQKTDPRFLRRQYRSYLTYLGQHESLVTRLCASGVSAWVAFGERDDVRLSDRERRELGTCPRTTLVTIPDAGHMTINEKPSRVAQLILEMTSVPAEGRSRAA